MKEVPTLGELSEELASNITPGLSYVPGATEVYHTIESGESIQDIADKYGLDSWEEIYETNKHAFPSGPSLPYPGTIIRIPDNTVGVIYVYDSVKGLWEQRTVVRGVLVDTKEVK